jgi:hypothetical protein
VAKSAKAKEKDDGLSPQGEVKLSSLAEVRTEMARMYRLALKRTIAAEETTKYVYILREIRACIESGTLEDVQAQLAAISTKMETRRGH